MKKRQPTQNLTTDQTDSTVNTANHQTVVDTIDHPTPMATLPKNTKKNISQTIAPTAKKITTPKKLTKPKASFLVNNAMSGSPFRAKIEGKNVDGQSVQVHAVKVPEETGLTFDPTTKELHGTPDQAGEYQLGLQWSYNDDIKRSGICDLTVNANPKNLWKNIDPDPNAPFFRENVDAKLIPTDAFKLVAASKRGRSHAHVGSFRDDAFFLGHTPSGWSVLIVADGAGSAKYSRQGSDLAVRTVGTHLLESFAGNVGTDIPTKIKAWEKDPEKGAKPLKDAIYYLFGKAVSIAVKAIDDQAKKANAAFKDFSTTLLISICRWDDDGVFVASFWVGDGVICVFDQESGNITPMGTPDSGEFAGQTSFLDKSTVSSATAIWDRIHFKRFDRLTALILMTDGVSDPRFETDSGLAKYEKWDALWQELTPILQKPEPDKALADWLDFFSPGHHDDRTIAILW